MPSSTSATASALSLSDFAKASMVPLQIEEEEPLVLPLINDAVDGTSLIGKYAGEKMGAICFVVRRPG